MGERYHRIEEEYQLEQDRKYRDVASTLDKELQAWVKKTNPKTYRIVNVETPSVPAYNFAGQEWSPLARCIMHIAYEI